MLSPEDFRAYVQQGPDGSWEAFVVPTSSLDKDPARTYASGRPTWSRRRAVRRARRLLALMRLAAAPAMPAEDVTP